MRFRRFAAWTALLLLAAGAAHAQQTVVRARSAQSQPGQSQPAQPAPMPPQAAAPAKPAPEPAPAAEEATVTPLPPPPLDAAYDAVRTTTLPLRPDQIRDLRRRLDETQRAASELPGGSPKPRTKSIEVSLEPGAPTPRILLGPGRTTSISVHDMTGQPWAIAAVAIGNPRQIDAQLPVEGGNMIAVTPLAHHPQGNLVVYLQRQSVPIVVDLVRDDALVDYRVDLQVAAFGPSAMTPILASHSPQTPGGAELMAFLDGVPPAGARPLRLEGGEAAAWKFAGSLILRTRMSLLSPDWHQQAGGPGNVNVYMLPDVPVILATDAGRTVTLTIKD